ncbi:MULTISPECIES: LytR C-terminal domain-containing protein [unclassified Mumia]|uniref:LytR C-terminal domain-containing protein n=1 Tax=unclassified Mumia TaxID=2621872 RepID=UPI00210777AC|nr:MULTISPECIES: LytR C-terminal domain-containing protein [unclassified Mumia]MDD9349833.1 LytR C-terminal domain-containing protein [Mumia sp.]
MTRGLRTFLTMSVLSAILIGGTYTGVQLLFAKAPELPDADATTACRNRVLEPGEQIAPNQVLVNVLNAGGLSGMANRTALNLQGIGFLPGTVGNAPEGTSIANVRVVAPEPKRVDARLVGAQFKGKVQYTKGTPEDDATVEVYIGKKFKGLKKNPVMALKAKNRVTICVPTLAVDPGA